MFSIAPRSAGAAAPAKLRPLPSLPAERGPFPSGSSSWEPQPDGIHQRPSSRSLIGPRGLQIALGALWLLDGVLQLQSFMFTRAFSQTVLGPVAAGQPRVLGVPILWFAHLVGSHPVLWNTAFAVIQIAIGVGLLIPRTVRPALIASVVWAGGVWCFGEGLGGILTGSASPLTGAPGAVLVYGLLGVIAWPWGGRWDIRRGARAAWAALWCTCAVLWLLPAERAGGAVRSAITAAVPGAPSWLHGLLDRLAGAAGGHGSVIALTISAVSVLIGLGVYSKRPVPFVITGGVLAAAMWIAGQSAGGLLSGQSTDPNIGPLFVLLAVVLLPRAGSTPQETPVPKRSAVWSPLILRGTFRHSGPQNQRVLGA
jgi:hypothetical protein